MGKRAGIEVIRKDDDDRWKPLEKVQVKPRRSEHLDGDGTELFAHACKLGLEGIVSKDRTRPYRSGPSKSWLKIKNPQAPGALRFEDRDVLERRSSPTSVAG